MVTSIKPMTVMFADVAGSTTLYKKLVDEQANRIIYDVILMMSKVTVDSLTPLFQSDCRAFDRISLKGKSEETVIYEVLWEKADDVTRMPTMINFNNAVAPEQLMHLKYLDKELSLKTESPVISIG